MWRIGWLWAACNPAVPDRIPWDFLEREFERSARVSSRGSIWAGLSGLLACLASGRSWVRMPGKPVMPRVCRSGRRLCLWLRLRRCRPGLSGKRGMTCFLRGSGVADVGVHQSYIYRLYKIWGTHSQFDQVERPKLSGTLGGMSNVGPNSIDADQFVLTEAAMAGAVNASEVRVTAIGTPHVAELRQVRPDEELGMGFRPGADGDML